MRKSEIRVKTKLLAKATMRPIFIKAVFILALELMTAIVLSMVFAEVANRLFPEATVTLWEYKIPYMEALFGIIGSLFSLPLTLGIAEYLLKVVRLKEAKATDIFQWFSESDKLKTVFVYFIWIAIFSVFAFVMQSVPLQYITDQIQTVLDDLNMQINSGSAVLSINYSLINYQASAISAGIIALFFIISSRFILIPYLMVDDLKLNSIKAAGKSWGIMRGHTIEYVVLMLSFAGWFFATMLTALIVGVYFYPYLEITIVIFSEYVRADKKLRDNSELAIEQVKP